MTDMASCQRTASIHLHSSRVRGRNLEGIFAEGRLGLNAAAKTRSIAGSLGCRLQAATEASQPQEANLAVPPLSKPAAILRVPLA